MTATDQAPSRVLDERPPGDRFVAGSLFVHAGVVTALQVASGELIPPLAVGIVLTVVLGVAVARRGARWMLVLAAVLGSLQLVGGLPFIVANLAHPESPASFLFEAFSVLASVSILAGALVGLRRPGRSRRPIALGAVGLAVVAILVAAVASASVESAERQPGDVEIAAVHMEFPERVEIAAGGSALWIDNRDAFHHTFAVEGTGIRVVLPARTAVRAEVDLPAGTYTFICDVPGHERMTGELEVRP